MATLDYVWYLNSVGYAAVTARPQNTAVAAGVIRRQFTTPAVGSERCFVCIVAGTTANVTDATWVTSRGAKTVDGTATWQECTGMAAVNGDLTNTPSWAAMKAAVGTQSLGLIVKRNNGASYQICSTAGTVGASEPSFSDTAGVTTNDGSAVWTSLGPVGNFGAGGAPMARFQHAYQATWLAGGNIVYVGDNHAETQTSSYTTTSGANSSNIIKVLCHNHSGSYPPAASDITTGAQINTSTNAAVLTLTCVSMYFYGITFKMQTGASTGSGAGLIITTSGGANQGWGYFDNCSFQIANTSASGVYIQLGGGSIVFNNCTVSFAHVLSVISLIPTMFRWQNTGPILAVGSVVPTVLFDVKTVSGINAVLEAIDLSQITTTIFDDQNPITSPYGSLLIKDCKLPASPVFGSPNYTGMTVQIVRSDSAAIAYKSTRLLWEGTETTETAITRVGGAVDPAGQAQSRKIVTSANAAWMRPFQAEPYAVWNPTTGANVTVTVYGTINSASLPNDDDLWLELSYLGQSANPLGTLATTTKASPWLTTSNPVASDGSAWNGGGSGAGWSPFKLTKTLSSPQPAFAGFLEARVKVGKLSSTYYIDPQVELS